MWIVAGPWLRGGRASQPDADEVARQQQAVADLKAGLLPASALARLHEETAFAAEMSPAEFLALRAAGYEVAGQVFGTATYQISTTAQRLNRYSVHPGSWSGAAPYSSATTRANAFYRRPLPAAPQLMATYHDGANAARATALRRLQAECRELEADGVVGVRFVRSSGGDGGGHEFTVVGTAVRRAGAARTDAAAQPPFTTMLTATEVGALARAGWRPVELLYEHQRYGGHGGYVATGGSGRLNPLAYASGEIVAASTVATFATAESRRRLSVGLGAGAGLLLHSVEIDTDVAECRLVESQTDLVVDVEAVATSIVPVATFTVRRERPALQVTPVVRLS